MVTKHYVSYLRVSTLQGENGWAHHGEQIALFVEVDSGKRSDRRQPAAAMAKKRKLTLLVAKLDRLSQRRVDG